MPRTTARAGRTPAIAHLSAGAWAAGSPTLLFPTLVLGDLACRPRHARARVRMEIDVG